MYWAIVVVVTLIVYFKIIKPHRFWKERNVPYEKTWPLLGEFAPIVFKTSSFPDNIQRIYNQIGEKRYSGMYQFLLPTLFIKDPDIIQQVTVKDFNHFIDHRTIISPEEDPLFGNNLLALTGQKWKDMRATMSPAYTSSKMRGMFTLMTECAEQFVDYFVNKGSNLITLEMKDTFTRTSNDVIASTAFGLKCDSFGDRNNEFYLMGRDATTFTGFRALKLFGYSFSPFLMKLFGLKIIPDKVGNFFRNIVLDTITYREKENVVRPDMIHLLMAAKKGKLRHNDENDIIEKSSNNDKKLTDDEVVANALLFFLAGFETASSLMCFMAYELALNPEVQEQLQKEIDQVLKQCQGKITYDALHKMNYLDMVISETLRKWPPLPVTDRKCISDYTIKVETPEETNILIEKDMLVWIPIFALHKDEKNFPNPEKFDPERFSDENKSSIKPGTYLPFGIGPRNCIGSRFALMEAKTIIFYLLSKFTIEVTEKTPIPMVFNKAQFTLTAVSGFWLAFRKRNNI